MRFHKTTNVPYQMVYDSETEREFTDMYSMLDDLNQLAREKEKLKKILNSLAPWASAAQEDPNCCAELKAIFMEVIENAR